MKPTNLLIAIQRFVMIELEAMILILFVHVLMNLLFKTDMDFTQVIWINLLFVLTALPLFYILRKKMIYSWLIISFIGWSISGYFLGVSALWISVVLGIWRSISVANEHNYLGSTYKRIIISIAVLTIYLMTVHLYHIEVWWAIPMLVTGCFSFTIVGIACHNLLEQYRWKPSREDWIRICRNQLLFIVTMGTLVGFFVYFRFKIIFLLTKILFLFGKLVSLITTPLIILLSKMINFFYSLINEGSKREVKMKMEFSDMLNTVKVNDDSPSLEWLWILLTIIASVSLLIFFVRKIKNSFYREPLKNEEMNDWIEMVDQQFEKDTNNHFFSDFVKKILRRNSKLDKIRLLYMDFLKQYDQKMRGENLASHFTTRDIAKKASEQLPVNIEDLNTLTKLYEEHRYGNQPTDTTRIEEMKKSVEEWLK
ncbi:DUF4129 domain-containing protein [Bacillus sp. CGMCC 1.16607]|uniref:DUF4129 domain-containing protein n=1 Tax=Bacillus sp. CGMCC 1.16607 TaxID=3351842 RepID=UPI00362B45F8